MMKTIKAESINFRPCCNRLHCRVYVMEFVNKRGRVFAAYETEGIEWQEVFQDRFDDINNDRKEELRKSVALGFEQLDG